MIKGIHHTAISTGNIERALRFYKDLLGFEELFAFEWKVGIAVSRSNCGTQGLFLKSRYAQGPATPAWSCSSTPHQSQSQATQIVRCATMVLPTCVYKWRILTVNTNGSKTAGMTFHCAPQKAGKGLRATYGRDPDGNVVELLEVEDPGR